ncbi:kinase-like protein [Hymenopellis radicata]|nr:kinase-like protein [Hymenopellis radicata]
MFSQRPALTGPVRRARPLARKQMSWSNICAKLVTFKNGGKDTIVVGLNKSASIGRDPKRCTYVVSDASVSGVHCKISAVRSPSGGIIVSCEDCSKNGIVLNERRIKKGRVILMDGDSLRLPDSITFTVIHLWKEPLSVLQPTRPQPLTVCEQIGPYLLTSQCLGEGSFAKVHLAFDTVNLRQIACKIIRTKRKKDVAPVAKEIKILKNLDHPNINRIYASEVRGNYIYLFLQLCAGGDLFTYITSTPETGNQLCEAEAKFIMFQLLEALRYLHNRSIAHRGEQPENILLHGPGPYPRILLADFGLARLESYQATFTVCGTIPYLPPEGIFTLHTKHMGYVGIPADCWSAGVILYIMLSGAHPFDYDATSGSSYNWSLHSPNAASLRCSKCYASLDASSQCSECYHKAQKRAKERILNGAIDFDRTPWDCLPKAKALVESLLIDDPDLRATVFSALDSEWIKSELEKLKAAYQYKIIASLPPDERPKRRV